MKFKLSNYQNVIQPFTKNLFRKIAQNRKRNSGSLRMIAKSVYFSRKNVAQRKQKFALFFAKVLRIETL